MSELFAEERRELKAVIERQLGELQRRPSGGIKIASVFPPDGQSTPASAAHSASVHGTPPPKARRTRNLLPAAGLVAATLIGVSVVRAMGGWGEAPAVASADTAAIPAKPPEAPTPSVSAASVAPAAMIRLTVEVSPPEATLTIDEGPTLDNPHVGSVVADGNEHVVRAHAAGYLPKTATIRFDRDADLKLTLERVPSGQSAAGPGPRDPAKPRPKRPIDEDSPWK